MRRALVVLFLGPASAQAEEATLRADLRIDIPVTVGTGAVAGAVQVFQAELAPTSCHWCSANSIDGGARDALRWPDSDAPKLTSDLLVGAVLPLASLATLALAARGVDHFEDFPREALVLVESVLTAVALVQVLKVGVGRERPFVHALPEDEKAATLSPSDNNVSFYSGHTTVAFSLVVATATIATIERRRIAPWIWAVGLPLAAFAGYLRIAADRHYLTDVLTGAATGSAIGFGLPWVLHGP